jgi:uncharacterized surface protein with fasciclin (FAS1) repeats
MVSYKLDIGSVTLPIPYTDIVAGESEANLEGDNITFVSLDGNLEITDGSGNEGAIIGITDIQAINGVIHPIPNNFLFSDTQN